jgi:hypothetical protein
MVLEVVARVFLDPGQETPDAGSNPHERGDTPPGIG